MYKLELPLLPGEPRDGSGRALVHYLVRCAEGPVRLPVDARLTRYGVVNLGGGVGYIACQPERSDVRSVRLPDGFLRMFFHTNDPHAVTCPKCLEHPAFKKHLESINEKVEQPQTQGT